MRDNAKGGALTEVTFYILLSLYTPKHGYAVMQFIEEKTGGRLTLGAGTLYGALNSLERKGWIAPYGSSSGRKKEYLITARGREAAETELARLRELTQTASGIIGGGTGRPSPYPVEELKKLREDAIMYCEKCNAAFASDACPVCGSRHVRAPLPNDLCFLTEKGVPWSDMLEDVLKQNSIPVFTRKAFGAGMTLSVGTMLEQVKFYVPYSYFQEAEALLNGLFSAPEDSSSF